MCLFHSILTDVHTCIKFAYFLPLLQSQIPGHRRLSQLRLWGGVTCTTLLIVGLQPFWFILMPHVLIQVVRHSSTTNGWVLWITAAGLEAIMEIWAKNGANCVNAYFGQLLLPCLNDHNQAVWRHDTLYDGVLMFALESIVCNRFQSLKPQQQSHGSDSAARAYIHK